MSRFFFWKNEQVRASESEQVKKVNATSVFIPFILFHDWLEEKLARCKPFIG